MYQSSLLSFPCPLYEKSALLYLPETGALQGVLLYFHGGGLLFGSKGDLPPYQIERYTEAGFAVLAFDYPLAPAADLDVILTDVLSSIRLFAEDGISELPPSLPYFLWGRSAGAFLSLLAETKLPSVGGGKDFPLPAGILSYYGYGFFTDGWYDTPCAYYGNYPAPSLRHPSEGFSITAEGAFENRYGLYVEARQKGSWLGLLSKKKKDAFLKDHSLKFTETPHIPVFAAHSINDPDVPYTEFEALCEKYNPTRYLSTSKDHDFDRTDGTFLKKLFLDSCIDFLRKTIGRESVR